jgi:hypothetical protein
MLAWNTTEKPDQVTDQEDRPQQKNNENIYELKRTYWKHKATDGKSSFRRSITSVIHEGNQFPVVILHYDFANGDEVPLSLSPHTNRKYGNQLGLRTAH